MADYLRDPAAIYAQSFAAIAAEVDLARFDALERAVTVRLIHACGMVDVVDDIVMSPGAAGVGRAALRAGAAIVTDVEMVRHGIIAARLPAHNGVECRLRMPEARAHADRLETTLSAGAMEAARDVLPGSIVVIGNAPTALFHLLEMIEDGLEPPALIVGIPVGFVGAVESKQALAAHSSSIPFITVHGRRGGSAMAAAVVNALAGEAA